MYARPNFLEIAVPRLCCYDFVVALEVGPKLTCCSVVKNENCEMHASEKCMV